MTIDGLDSVTYFCRGNSFHDFQTPRPLALENPGNARFDQLFFCHGRPFNTCTTGCLWWSLILKCHHPSVFFGTPRIGRALAADSARHFTGLVGYKTMQSPPCLVGFWVHIHCTHDLSTHKANISYFFKFFAIHRSIVIRSVNNYQNPLFSVSVNMISIRTWHQCHTKRQRAIESKSHMFYTLLKNKTVYWG